MNWDSSNTGKKTLGCAADPASDRRPRWLCPGINFGCVVKFDDNGNILESLWDPGGVSHPTITSMREQRGYLYIGGLENNRIGRLRLPDADPNWTGWDSYYAGKRQDNAQQTTQERVVHVARA